MNWGGIASGLAGAGRGYEASQGRDIPGPTQQQGQNGLLMKYLNRQKNQGLNQQAAQSPVKQSPSMAQAAPGWDPTSPIPPVPQNQYQDPMGGAPPMYRPPTPMAQGQIVDKPTTALLGEDGPEAVIPLSGRADAKVSTANMPKMNYRRGC